MIIVKSIKKVKETIGKVKKKNKLVGFVPTMGALHLGHLSLVKAARQECDFVATSIFVNPMQFGPKEDYCRYPRNFKKDRELLVKEKVDLLFCPLTKTMYGSDFSTYVNENYLSKVLCGKFRPLHFRGVCTVVAKLFNIVEPDIAYFGQKDYQQAQIVKRMVADLNFPIKIKVSPTIREKDGLAMSSRNTYLNNREREDAALLYAGLGLGKKLIEKGEKEPKRVINEIKKMVKSKKTIKIDYIKIVDANSLQDLTEIKGRILVALAVYVGRIRLIDNIVLGHSSGGRGCL